MPLPVSAIIHHPTYTVRHASAAQAEALRLLFWLLRCMCPPEVSKLATVHVSRVLSMDESGLEPPQA